MPRKRKMADVEFKRVETLSDGSKGPFTIDVLLYMLASLKSMERLLEEQNEMLEEYLYGEEDD